MCGITNGVVFLTVLGYRHYNRRSTEQRSAGECIEKLAKKSPIDQIGRFFITHCLVMSVMFRGSSFFAAPWKWKHRSMEH